MKHSAIQVTLNVISRITQQIHSVQNPAVAVGTIGELIPYMYGTIIEDIMELLLVGYNCVYRWSVNHKWTDVFMWVLTGRGGGGNRFT